MPMDQQWDILSMTLINAMLSRYKKWPFISKCALSYTTTNKLAASVESKLRCL